jgi:hypothetical protein
VAGGYVFHACREGARGGSWQGARGQWITYGLWATAGQDDIVHGPWPVGGLGGGSDGHGPRRTTAQRELGRGLDGGQGLARRCK